MFSGNIFPSVDWQWLVPRLHYIRLATKHTHPAPPEMAVKSDAISESVLEMLKDLHVEVFTTPAVLHHVIKLPI